MTMFSIKKSDSSRKVTSPEMQAKKKSFGNKNLWKKQTVKEPVNLESLMQQVKKQNAHAEERARKAEERAEKAEKRAEKAEERALKAEQKAQRAEAKLEAILDNVSSIKSGYMFC